GGEDQLVAGARQLLDRALRIGPFVDVLEVAGLDLVAEMLDQRLAADLVLIGPAEVADRPEVNETDLQLILGGRSERARGKGERGNEAAERHSFHKAISKIFDSSCSAKAAHPVNTSRDLFERPVVTGSPAFAGDDDRCDC